MAFGDDPVLRNDRQVRREVEEEFDFHYDMVVKELRGKGLGARAAREEAERRFGSRERHLQSCRRIGRRRRLAATSRAWWHGLSHDVLFSLRALRRAPMHTALVLVTLALAIGATTLVFSLLDGVALRPMALEAPESLYVLWGYDLEDQSQEWASAPNFADWQKMNRSFSSMAAYSWSDRTLSGLEAPERLTVAVVTAEFFSTLGARPGIGRVLESGELADGDQQVVVASHGFWQRQLGGRPDAVGQSIELDRESYTVIGVMPETFEYPGGAELWAPLILGPEDLADSARGAQWLIVVGRLRDGVSREEAQTDLTRVGELLAAAHPDRNRDRGVVMVPLRDDFVERARSPLGILFGAVLLVLLIGVLNVVGLSVARAAARQYELGVRSAIGAGRGRIGRQLMVESLILAAVGGLAGIGLAWAGLELVRTRLPVELPRLAEVSLDARVLATMTAVIAVCGLVSGLWPAWRARADASRLLRPRAWSKGGRWLWGRRTLVIVETAMSVVLVIAVGLFVRSLWYLGRVDLGFEPAGVLTFRVGLPESVYSEREQWASFFDQLDQSVSALPGVEAVGLNPWPPPASGWWFSYEPLAKPIEGSRQPSAAFRFVNDRYFEALGIEVLAGRVFERTDRVGSPPVIVVNRTLAERHFGDGDPGTGVRNAVGQQMFVGYGNPEGGSIDRTIIGVVEDTRQFGPARGSAPTIYVSHLQVPFDVMTVALRTQGDPMALLPQARAEVARLDPQLAVERPEPLAARLSRTLDTSRFVMRTLAAFAVLALVLAIVGVYGVMAQLVTQREHEIGVRMAVGADRSTILSWVLGRGLLMAGVGVGLGLIAALAVLRILTSQLVGVSTLDPVAYGLAAVVLLVAAGLACWLPARRASRVDALALLRSQ